MMTRRPCLPTYDPLPDIILDLYSIPTSSLSTWVLHIVYIINRSWTSDSLSFVVVCCCLLMSFCRSVVQSSTMRTRRDSFALRLRRQDLRIFGGFSPSRFVAGYVRTYMHARECLSLEETVIACRNSTPTYSDQSPLLNIAHSIFQPNDRSCVRRDVVGKTADSDIARGLAAIAFTRTVPQAGPINS